MKYEYIVTVYSASTLGMLTRIAAIFSRRRINIEFLQVGTSELKGIHRFLFCIVETEEVTRNLSLQIEKQIDVLKSCYHTTE